MSSVYVHEPATSGKVLLVTSFGDVDIELWCKECPLACRNFIQLCMEGYYDNLIFHRLVKGFIIQTGDPTGTGEGGDSVYGEPFRDEFHQRLKFSRRGLVGCASSQPNDNNSQFFITLDHAEELTNKHTLFGKVTGNTIFNVLKMGELPTDENERPEEPPRIVRTEVLTNPFHDIKPRKLAPRVPQEEDETAKRKQRRKRRVKAVKNFKLMSFGEEAEEDEHVIQESTKKLGKLKSSHDVLQDERLASSTASEQAARQLLEADEQELREQAKAKAKRKASGEDAPSKKDKLSEGTGREGKHGQESETERRLDAIKREAEELKRELKAAKTQAREATEHEAQSKPMSEASQFLSQERTQLLKEGRSRPAKKKKKGGRESETLALLAKFKAKLGKAGTDGAAADRRPEAADAEKKEEDMDDLAAEVTDTTWLHHKLTNEIETAPKGIDPEMDPKNLDIHDPRNPLNIRRRKQESKDRRRHRERR